MFQILTDYDNDDKRVLSRKPNREQNENDAKFDEKNEEPAPKQNVNENQQRRAWQTKNINATQYQNKNKSTKRNSEIYTSSVSNKTAQKSHEEIDILDN